jgi:hypothetical protein
MKAQIAKCCELYILKVSDDGVLDRREGMNLGEYKHI